MAADGQRLARGAGRACAFPRCRHAVPCSLLACRLRLISLGKAPARPHSSGGGPRMLLLYKSSTRSDLPGGAIGWQGAAGYSVQRSGSLGSARGGWARQLDCTGGAYWRAPRPGDSWPATWTLVLKKTPVVRPELPLPGRPHTPLTSLGVHTCRRLGRAAGGGKGQCQCDAAAAALSAGRGRSRPPPGTHNRSHLALTTG